MTIRNKKKFKKFDKTCPQNAGTIQYIQMKLADRKIWLTLQPANMI